MISRLTFCFFLLALFRVGANAQDKIICNGKRISFNRQTTIVSSSTDCKSCKSYILNDKAIDFSKPAYPAEARRQRISGAISLQITINEDGKVESVTAVLGPPLLRSISIKALKKTRFKKLILDCQPTKYSGIFIINFGPP
jgi:TonB family protein